MASIASDHNVIPRRLDGYEVILISPFITFSSRMSEVSTSRSIPNFEEGRPRAK